MAVAKKRCRRKKMPKKCDEFDARLGRLVRLRKTALLSHVEENGLSCLDGCLDDDEEDDDYMLHGVISHLGSSPECGHYVAHVCDRPKEKGGWTTYDDEDVKEVWPSAVLGIAQERQCYVAVYVLDEKSENKEE